MRSGLVGNAGRGLARRALARFAIGAAVTGVASRRAGAASGTLFLDTARGAVEMRYAEAPGDRAVCFVGGVGGGFDSPARDLYGRLADSLPEEGIATLRVRFRQPTQLEESVAADLSAGLAELERWTKRRMGFVGHSFGGAVVIRAAAAAERVRAVVTLATQSYGAGLAAELGPRCALLLIHGTRDTVLPSDASRLVFDLAEEPKRLVILPGAGHGLDEAAPEVERLVRDWLQARL
jgi:pimeloyl-ACP methyl ester carboxylesterase